MEDTLTKELVQSFSKVNILAGISVKGAPVFSIENKMTGQVVNLVQMVASGNFTYLEKPFSINMFDDVVVNKQGIKELAEFRNVKLMLCANSMLYVIHNGVSSALYTPCSRSIVSGCYINSAGKLVAPANTIYSKEDYPAMVAVAQATSFNTMTSKPLGFGSKINFLCVNNKFVASGASIYQVLKKLGSVSDFAPKSKSLNEKSVKIIQDILMDNESYKWVYPPQTFDALVTEHVDLYDIY